MNDNQFYISIRAQKLCREHQTETYDKLRNAMFAEGLNPGTTNRALGRQISTAYDHAVKEKNQGVADCIALAYTDKSNEYLWE